MMKTLDSAYQRGAIIDLTAIVNNGQQTEDRTTKYSLDYLDDMYSRLGQRVGERIEQLAAVCSEMKGYGLIFNMKLDIFRRYIIDVLLPDLRCKIDRRDKPGANTAYNSIVSLIVRLGDRGMHDFVCNVLDRVKVEVPSLSSSFEDMAVSDVSRIMTLKRELEGEAVKGDISLLQRHENELNNLLKTLSPEARIKLANAALAGRETGRLVDEVHAEIGQINV